ncbi:GTPBP3 isoform 23 [Pongo abelii]|uniref:GTPBP3 isoform 23 n=1 Tax=Pongo abelii TaxID=9601 RepID=A0A2J8T6G2_PONAB|nr:GTPBP3 isoform 23 [Pongo abelii]
MVHSPTCPHPCFLLVPASEPQFPHLQTPDAGDAVWNIVHSPEQRPTSPRLRRHHLRAKLWPRPLRHRGDPDQRLRQRPRPPNSHGTPRPAPCSPRQRAPPQRPPLRGASGPRTGTLVPRSPEFHW